jgi:peptidoglycan hydrolase-like protein with peptidoglycan-binding domain
VPPSAATKTVTTDTTLVCVSLEIKPDTISDEVRTIQKFLRAQGYTKVKNTGEYGPLTERAVRHFQDEHAADILVPAGLTKATGTWGERTALVASRMGLCDYDTLDDAPLPTASAVAAPTESTEKTCLSKVILPSTTSADVRAIQKFLISYGYTKVEVTGYYGPTTKRAVVFFQTKFASDILTPAGFSKPTGQWGPYTAKKASEEGLCKFVK